MKLRPVEEQVVVIFGASSGIGRQTALDFGQRGAKVVVAARDEAGLNSLVQEIKQDGGEAIAIVADAIDFNQVKAVADGAVQTYGRLDTWVHAAAIAVYAKFIDTTPEEFKRVVEVNLTGQAYGAMAALPHIWRNAADGVGGALIHISSMESQVGMPYHSSYAASKHGMKGFLDVLRMELEHEGAPISVTNIMPAGINTPFFNNACTKLGVLPMPIPPIYSPNLVSQAILHAAENPIPEIVVGGAAKTFIIGKRLAPRMTDALVRKMGFTGQLTDHPKSEDAPNAFVRPETHDHRVHGDFSDQERGSSFATWFEERPLLHKAVRAAAIGGVLLVAARARGRA